MFWGKYKENGIWLTGAKENKIMFFGHDSLYIAVGKLRLRFMKP